MKIEILSIHIETIFAYNGQDCTAWTDDGRATIHREMYGMDADGHRGVNNLWVENTFVPTNTVETNAGFKSGFIIKKAKEALEEELYKYDYFKLL